MLLVRLEILVIGDGNTPVKCGAGYGEIPEDGRFFQRRGFAYGFWGFDLMPWYFVILKFQRVGQPREVERIPREGAREQERQSGFGTRRKFCGVLCTVYCAVCIVYCVFCNVYDLRLRVWSHLRGSLSFERISLRSKAWDLGYRIEDLAYRAT